MTVRESPQAKAAREEPEAWKIAQLAATLIAGQLAAGGDRAPEAAEFVRQAAMVLTHARDYVARKN